MQSPAYNEGVRLLLALLPLLCAAQQPQLVWEGEVDGISVIYVRGNRLDIRAQQGLPVQRQRFRFYDRLPDSRQDVQLQTIEGRGRVWISEQPRLDNNYTMAVTIEDRQGGTSFYSLAFFWRTDRGGPYEVRPMRPPSNVDGRERLTWSGRVDDEAVIECRGNVCEPQSSRGQPVMRDRFQFTRPLPDRPVQVSLEDANGRGEVRLIEQPAERNNYAARILIRDPQGGAGDYSFTLAWNRPSRFESEPLYVERGLVWSGRVDGKVRVIVQGSSVHAEVMSGQPVTGDRAGLVRPLPSRNLPNARIKRLRGRGRVEIVEFPSSRNGYRLVFEIEDTDGGADNYEVEVSW